MWRKWAHTLATLNKLFSMKVKFNWETIEKKYFLEMNKIYGRDILLYYYNFSEEIIIHTDAIKFQLGGVISQNGKIHFLLPTQVNPCTNKLYNDINVTVK